MKKLQTIVSLILILSIIVGCASKGLDVIEPPKTEESSQESIEQSQVSKDQTPIETEDIKENSSSSIAEPSSPTSTADQASAKEAPPPPKLDALEIAFYDSGLRIYVPVKKESYQPILDSLSGIMRELKDKAPDNETAPGDRLSSILIIQKNYEKINYTTFSNGIKINDDFYLLDQPTRERIMNIAIGSDLTAYAEWLYWIKTPRVLQVKVANAEGCTYSGNNVGAITELVRKLEVAPATFAKSSVMLEEEGVNTIHMAFDSGTVYNINIDGEKLTIQSSDMSYTSSYILMEPTKAQDTLNLMISSYSTPAQPDQNLEPDQNDSPETAKPVIYLYPEKEQTVEVKLEYNGKLTYTFPAYNNGWKVSAKPDGTLTNLSDKTTHYYLFWEGIPNKTEWDFSRGSVVAGKDTDKFFQKVLPQMGLTPREYNDFIVFWTPILQENPYNLITFATEEYEELAKLEINPKPDSILLVHMVFRSLEKAEDATPTPQQFSPFERKGFTVVEWGGTKLG